MAKKYDVVVVGGGTSGLEAAKTAAQNGLKVALVEMKSDPAKVQRACAQMFLVNMDQPGGPRSFSPAEIIAVLCLTPAVLSSIVAEHQNNGGPCSVMAAHGNRKRRSASLQRK